MTETDRPQPGRRRPVLSVLALAALVAAGGFAARQQATSQEPPAGRDTQAASGPGNVYCPGPLTPSDSALAGGSDAELDVTGPSPNAAISAVSLEQDSGLLFGQTEVSSTLADPSTGALRKPWAQAFGVDGQKLEETTGSSDLGDAVLLTAPRPGTAQVVTGTAGDSTPVFDVAQATVTETGDFRSLAATRCPTPVTSATFLGASTERGSSATLVLRNTTSRAATATVQIWTPDGPAAMQGRSRVVVGPDSTKTVVLESIVPGKPAAAVGVDVIGAPLVMSMQTTAREGLAPRGAEILTAAPQADTTQTVTGVHVTGDRASLLVLNTNRTETVVRARAVGQRGEVAAASVEKTVSAGTLARIEMTGLTPDNYSVQVDSEEPVTTAVQSTVAGAALPGSTTGTPQDRATVVPAPPLTSGTVMAVPPLGTGGRLVLSSADGAKASVIPIRRDGSAGAPVAVDVRAGTAVTKDSASIGVGKDTAGLVLVPETGEITAAWVHLHADGKGANLVSVLPVRPATVATRGLTVRLER